MSKFKIFSKFFLLKTAFYGLDTEPEQEPEPQSEPEPEPNRNRNPQLVKSRNRKK